jgi:hypothetical protein
MAGRSPNFKVDLAIPIDQLKICPIGRDEAGPVGACSEGDENVEMQIAQFVGLEAMISADVSQYLARLQPVFFGRSQDWVSSRQRPEKLPIRSLRGAPP